LQYFFWSRDIRKSLQLFLAAAPAAPSGDQVRKFCVALLLLMPLAAAAQSSHVIIQKGRRFTPEQITINRGDSLTFTNEDEFIHQMYVDGLFDSDEKNPGETLVQSFTRAGTFEVHCHIHPKMRLVVRVN
jgi:plastocyanin